MKSAPQLKRSRLGPVGGDSFQAPAESSECGSLDVEYQVPTSSQRDQEDDIIVVTSEEEDDEDEGPEDDDDEEPDDGPEFQPDEDDENEEGYEIESYDPDPERDLVMANYDDVEGPDIDDDNGGEQDNEVVFIEDSNEVPNQPGSSSSSSGGPADATQHVGSSASGEQMQAVTATHVSPLQQQQAQPQQPQQPQQQPLQQDQQQSSSEATSSGATNQSDNGNSSSSNSSHGGPSGSGSGNNHVSSQGTPVSLGFGARSRTVPPLNRQQLVLGYEDGGDDCIVPSTPTLFVPGRRDGFGEAVSSPQVPSAGRFTFSDANPPAVRAGVAQVVCEGMDDTRVDLSQLEDPSTGRSVPTTPLQVSPQGDLAASELANEVGQSSGDNVEASGSLAGPSSAPSISVSLAEHQQVEGEAPSQRELLDLELETDQREAEGDGGELMGGQADEPEEVMVLDLEEESTDGVSSEGSKPPQPSQSQQALDLEMEEGREAEASEPAASSPQGSPHGSQGSPHGRGSGTARRSHSRPGSFRRGRGNQRPTPIVWSEPGSTSPRSMGDGPPRGRGMPMMPLGPMGPMGRGMMMDPRGFPPRGQRARRIRKGYGNPFGNMPY